MINLQAITLIYGPHATGKTTLCLQLARDLARTKEKVIFIDTEKSFSLERFEQLAKLDYQELLDYIMILPIKNFDEQIKKIQELESLKNISLIIIDSLTYYYRKELPDDVKANNAKMILLLRSLKHVCKDIPIILTGQVYQKIDQVDHVEPVGSDLIKRFCEHIIELKINPRRMLTRKPQENIKLFTINDEGITFC